MGIRERHSKPGYKYYHHLNESLYSIWCNECSYFQRSANRDTNSNTYSNTYTYTYTDEHSYGYPDAYTYIYTYAYSCSAESLTYTSFKHSTRCVGLDSHRHHSGFGSSTHRLAYHAATPDNG